MTARSSLFLAALVLASPLAAQTIWPAGGGAGMKTYAVRHVFRPGEKLLLISKTDFESTFRSHNGAPGGSHRVRGHIEWQLTTAPADKGKAVLVRMRWLRVRTEFEGSGEKKTTDSSKPETMSPEERESLPVMLKAVFTAEVDEKGSVREVTIPDEVVAAAAREAKAEAPMDEAPMDEARMDEDRIRKMFVAQIRQLCESLTVYQPPGPVFVGQTWAAERKSPEGGTKTKAECKLLSVEQTPAGRVATVAFKLRPDPDAAGQGPTQKLEGQVRYNIDRQRFVSSKVQTSESSGNGSFEMKRSVSVELRDLPAPTTRPAGGKEVRKDKP